jgi:1-deoxy-D-xylulose-5-phosphate reductoisomerase
MAQKHIAILGATGSIGRQALQVVERHPERFCVEALSARYSVDLLAEQILRFHPRIACLADAARLPDLEAKLPAGCKTRLVGGDEGLIAAATAAEAGLVLSAVVGAAGLQPTLAAIAAGKDIALANKETLVMAGELVMTAARAERVKIIPVDSEHSAIFQCLAGNRREDLEKILLTASGGPFRRFPRDRFQTITADDALNHPNWTMGRKITIDSATLMNKGLEVIEACWLFGVPLAQIEVVVHPQSIVHSMVAFHDGTVMAQMGVPDMRGAIAYALSYPQRLQIGVPAPDFFQLCRLDFERPDLDTFGCLRLALTAAATGGTAPAVLNAANEVAVAAFLGKQISFPAITRLIRKALDAHKPQPYPDLDQVLAADKWARHLVLSQIDKSLS